MASRDSVVLRPLPVLYACAGCSELGYSAVRVGRELERRGKVETIWLGLPGRRTARWPVISLDACDRRCARAWLEERGIQPQLAFVLTPHERFDPDRAVERIAAAL
jgi:uncharacterized metal-binding protein